MVFPDIEFIDMPIRQSARIKVRHVDLLLILLNYTTEEYIDDFVQLLAQVCTDLAMLKFVLKS